jgi:glycerol-3-phosphate dehydrogenase
MAEDVLKKCGQSGLLDISQRAQTKTLQLVGAAPESGKVQPIHEAPGLHSYGSEGDFVNALPGAQDTLCPGLTQAMVRFAARYEYATVVEDVLARRSRLLFLDAALASSLAERVGEILMDETACEPEVEEFRALAAQYLPAH